MQSRLAPLVWKQKYLHDVGRWITFCSDSHLWRQASRVFIIFYLFFFLVLLRLKDFFQFPSSLWDGTRSFIVDNLNNHLHILDEYGRKAEDGLSVTTAVDLFTFLTALLWVIHRGTVFKRCFIFTELFPLLPCPCLTEVSLGEAQLFALLTCQKFVIYCSCLFL